jgi:hypothetical protein
MQFDRLRRRELITLLGGAAVAWPFAVRARQTAMPLVGYIGSGARTASAHLVEAAVSSSSRKRGPSHYLSENRVSSRERF